MLHKRCRLRYASPIQPIDPLIDPLIYPSAREVARNAAPTISAAPISVRQPGVSPSNAKASAMP